MRLADRRGAVNVARQYRIGPNESAFVPPARRPGEVQVHGLGERHWSLLALLAEHGALHTGQVVTLLFGSRPAAVRPNRAGRGPAPRRRRWTSTPTT